MSCCLVLVSKLEMFSTPSAMVRFHMIVIDFSSLEGIVVGIVDNT